MAQLALKTKQMLHKNKTCTKHIVCVLCWFSGEEKSVSQLENKKEEGLTAIVMKSKMSHQFVITFDEDKHSHTVMEKNLVLWNVLGMPLCQGSCMDPT